MTELSRVEASHEALDRLGHEVDELRASRERIVRAEDDERRSLERDLHDGPQQDLIALAVNLQLARELVERDPGTAADLLEDMGRDVQRALERTALLAHRIYPPLLETGGLGAALRAAAVATGVRTEISAEVAKLPSATAGTVYFCWLDALEGTRGSGLATITVVVDDGVATFEIGGVGQAPPDEVLARMRDRVGAIGGGLTTEPSADGWTAVGRLPLSR
jgi:signal transduction histidine kinase